MDSVNVVLVQSVVSELIKAGSFWMIVGSISLPFVLIGAYTIYKAVKGSKKSSGTGQTSVNFNTSDNNRHVCASHAGLEKKITKVMDQNVEIISSIDELSIWVQRTDNQMVTVKRRKTIMEAKVIDTLKMFWDDTYREFAVAKASLYIDFILDNIDMINNENSFELFKEKFQNEGKGVYDLAVKVLGKCAADRFYKDHESLIIRYLNDVKHIYSDKLNDKIKTPYF